MAAASPLATNDGRIVLVSGASRCGKTTYVARRTKADRRIIAWDPEDQWSKLPGFVRVTSRMQLAQAIQTKGRMRVAYVPSGVLKAEFEFWASAVWYAIRHVAGCTIIGEELADVTTVSKAPPAWGMIIRRGLKRGAMIYTISQRWAEADKTTLGNASEAILFMVGSDDDARYLGRKFGVPWETIAELKPLEYIHRDVWRKETNAAKLTF